MRIRTADLEDTERLVLLVRGFRDHLGATAPSDDEIAQVLPKLLADPAIEFCIAAGDDGSAAGFTHSRFFLSLWAPGTEAYLEDLFVVPSARGAGLGLRLMQFALRRAEERGAREIALTTNENNQPAQALYRKVGFRPASEARWGDGRELRWERDLLC